jgi:hypothetical protein
MILFRIPDPYDVTNSIYHQDFIFKNAEKKGQIKFCLKYDFNYDLFLHEKGKFFPLLLFVGSGSEIKKTVGSRSWIPKNGRFWIRDKLSGSATLIPSQVAL